MLLKRQTLWILRNNMFGVAIFISALLPLSAYYLYTLFLGKGGQIETPGLGNLGYAAYEFMGFSGLAASKNQIRESTNLVGLMITYIPMILPLIASYLFILIILLKKKISIFRSYYLISFLVGISIFVTFAFIFKFRFWGRHLLYLYPFFILFMSDVLTEYYCEIRNMKKIYKVNLLIWFLFWGISCTRIIFSDDYKKEDIKKVAEEVTNIKNQHELVFWSEHPSTAWYYNINQNDLLCRFPEKNEAGLFVWFKRLNWINGEDFEEKIEPRDKELVMETKEAKIYRIKNENN